MKNLLITKLVKLAIVLNIFIYNFGFHFEKQERGEGKTICNQSKNIFEISCSRVISTMVRQIKFCQSYKLKLS